MVKLFIYGTLRKGERNEHKLQVRSRKNVVLHDYEFIPRDPPYIIPHKGRFVEGELVDVPLNRWNLLRLDLFEWGYKRTKVFIDGEECWAYVWRKHFKA